REIAARWSPGRRFFNAYGPTEATVAASHYLVTETPKGNLVPIGRPISNTQLYLLDSRLRPVPVGIPGELHVGGVGLARGYLNRPELTAEKFIEVNSEHAERSINGVHHSLSTVDCSLFTASPTIRLYKTGDLACYRSDGNVEFLGRIDHQVKIRGFRIELGEIEAVLKGHPALQDAVVIARESGGEKRLVAYVVPKEESTPGIEELRGFLQAKLPAYMAPAAFVSMAALPLNPNGKVDRKALPAPESDRPDLAKTFVAPRDALELQLSRIWEDILGVHPVGVTDDFFELGGHSLLAVRLAAQVRQQLGRDLQLMALFQNATVEQLASALRHDQPGPSSLVEIQPRGAKRPLFFIHPSGGSVHWYADLARRLGKDQPFYGLQAKGVNGDQEIHTRIEEMAACYVAAIRAAQPEGPYQLGSWSMGVIIAFEMAQQIRAAGQALGTVVQHNAAVKARTRNGGEGAQPSGLKACSACGGRGETRVKQGLFAMARRCGKCGGAGRVVVIPCTRCTGGGLVSVEREFAVTLAPGVENASVTRVAGEGEPGRRGGTPGDLNVVVRVRPHPLL
ncbi:MAG: thioesterase domain-containing protein, partial [Chloroflexota bacterium]